MEGLRQVEAGAERFEGADDALLVRLALTEPAAFAQLYQRYLDRVYRYVYTYADCPEDAADLTQHIFLRVLEALPSYDERGVPFGAWLFRIARNAAVDAYRRRRKSLPWEHVPENLLPFAGPGPEEISVRRDELNQLRILVAQLDPAKQELLALRFGGRLTSAEIAAVLGKSRAAVKKQITRTLLTLKEQCGDR